METFAGVSGDIRRGEVPEQGSACAQLQGRQTITCLLCVWCSASAHHGVLSVQAKGEGIEEISSPPMWFEDDFKLKTSEQTAAMKENDLNKQNLPQIQLSLTPLLENFLFGRRLAQSTRK